jgi:REP-associated tyrosine transposase
MARMPRLVIPGFPHHVTQRGCRRMKTFFRSEDYVFYLELIAEFKELAGVEVWGFCLMPNHVHLVLVPERERSLATLFRHVHLRYTRRINFRERWAGHLWQERFHSFVMDEQHLIAAVRYTELNPVRAQLCSVATEWPWSSVHAHLAGEDDAIVSVGPMLQRVSDWPAYLSGGSTDAELESIRNYNRTGRPAGNAEFLQQLHLLTGKDHAKRKPGPKPANK